jgi:hypothetical protein
MLPDSTVFITDNAFYNAPDACPVPTYAHNEYEEQNTISREIVYHWPANGLQPLNT